MKYLRVFLNKTGLRRQRTIVFASPLNFHFQHFLSIIKTIENTPNLKMVIIEALDWKEYPPIENCVFITAKKFNQQRWAFTDVIISTDFTSIPWWFKSGVRVGLFHGAGPKVGFFEILANDTMDVIFSPGPYIRDLQQKVINNSKGRNTKLFPTGLPTMDKLYFDVLKNEKNPKNKKPVILYAPSWHVETSYVPLNEAIIKTLAQQDKYHIIVRPHPNLLNPDKCGGMDWKEMLCRYENENFELPFEGSIYQHLHKSDAIIGDYSSVIYEYLIFNKPGFLYVSDDILNKVFSYGVNEPNCDAIIKPLKEAFDTIPDSEKLMKILDHGMSNPDLRLNARQDLLKDSFYNVGTATNAAAKEILKLAGLEKNNLI